MRYFVVFFTLFLTGCTGIPEGIEPVRGFEVNRYLGKWYEVARLDHSFERGLNNVSAEYSLRADGGLKVINRGFDTLSNSWNEAEGKAYFVEDNNTAYLKVSFCGPFYGSYVVFDLGSNYEYSLVTSSDRSYLWLLSRTPDIEDDLKEKLLKEMTEMGFEKEALIFVEQEGLNR